jgi:hypothetical protein
MVPIAIEGQIRDDTAVTDVRRSLNERGQATVEFAIVLPLLLLLIVGLFAFGNMFNSWLSLNHLANEGARWTAVDTVPPFTLSPYPPNPGSATPAVNDLKLYIASQIASNGLLEKVAPLESSGTTRDLSNIGICYTPAGGSGAAPPAVGDAVTVTLKAPNPIGLFSFVMNITLRGSATMRLEQAPTGSGWGLGAQCT